MAKFEDTVAALTIGILADVPTCLWGGPGIAKTSFIEQIGEANDMLVETVIASISDPTDFKGMPREEAGRTVFSPPDWALNISDADGGIVFFDEISTAPPSVQAALLRPVLSKVVGSHRLPASTRFLMAANPPDIAADGWDLSAPMANRMMHLEWDIPASVVSDFFLYGPSPIVVPTLSDQDVNAAITETNAKVGGFINARPDLKYNMPKDSSSAGLAWPSPRSWTFGSRTLAFARALGAGQGVQNRVLAGCVGAPTSREFFSWEKNLDLPDIEQVLKSGGKVAVPATADKVVVLMSSLVAALKGKPTKGRIEAGVNGVLVAVADAGHRDLAVVALRKIGSDITSTKSQMSPAAMKHFAAILAEMGKIAKFSS